MANITKDSCRVELINPNTHGDVVIVNSARVSFDKETTLDPNGQLREEDKKLIRYLADHNHWTPFAHVREIVRMDVRDFQELLINTDPVKFAGCVWTKNDNGTIDVSHSLWGWVNLFKNPYTPPLVDQRVWDYLFTKLRHKAPYSTEYLLGEYGAAVDMVTVPVIDWDQRHRYFTLRETVPIYTARQRFKHMVEFNYNEVSRRYVDSAPEIFVPSEFRGRAENKKQGSSEDVIRKIHDLDTSFMVEQTANFADGWYTALINEGVCPEQARGLLPLSTMTSYYVTGTTAAWNRMLKQRLDSHSQKEIQELAFLVNDLLGDYL